MYIPQLFTGWAPVLNSPVFIAAVLLLVFGVTLGIMVYSYMRVFDAVQRHRDASGHLITHGMRNVYDFQSSSPPGWVGSSRRLRLNREELRSERKKEAGEEDECTIRHEVRSVSGLFLVPPCLCPV